MNISSFKVSLIFVFNSNIVTTVDTCSCGAALTLVVIYRPAFGNFSIFMEQLELLLEPKVKPLSNVVLLGDFILIF